MELSLVILDSPLIKQANYDMVLANVYYGSGKPNFKVFEKVQIEFRDLCRIDTGHRDFFLRFESNFFFVVEL